MGVQLINEKGKIRLESEITLAKDCSSFEALISNPEYKDRIKAAEKDFHLAHRIENKDGELISIAQRSLGKVVKAGEFSDLHQNHHKFLEFLCKIHTEERAKQAPLHQENMEHEPTDEEIIESLSQFLRETFGAIVIGVVRV